MTRGQAIGSMVLGALLLGLAAYGGWWVVGKNQSVDATLAAIEASHVVVSPELGIEDANDGRYVFLSGRVTASEWLRDEVTGLELEALVLKTSLEHEVAVRETTADNKTRTSYEWQTTIRPGLEGDLHRPEIVQVGGYVISPDLLDDLGFGDPIPCSDSRLRAPVFEERPMGCAEDGYFYAPEDVEDGELRFGLTAIPATHLSLVALQQDGELTQVANADGYYVRLIESERLDFADVLALATERRTSQKHLGLGFVAIPGALGLYLLIAPYWRTRRPA